MRREQNLPKALFPLVLKRLDEFSSQTTTHKSPRMAHWYSQSRLDSFLTARCSKDFLAQYIEAHPDVLPRVSDPGLMLNAVMEVDLAVRIFRTALPSLQSAIVDRHLRAVESAAAPASSPIKVEMASDQNLRYRSSPRQSRSTHALGWPERTGRSGLMPTAS